MHNMTRIWMWMPMMAAFVTTTALSLHSVQAGQPERLDTPSDERSLAPSMQTIFVEEGTDDEGDNLLLYQIEDSYAWRARSSIKHQMEEAQTDVDAWKEDEAWYDEFIKGSAKKLRNKQLLQTMITGLETSINQARDGEEAGLSVAKLQEVINSVIEAGREEGADEETTAVLKAARDDLIQKLSLPGMLDVLDAEMLAKHVLTPLAQKKLYTQTQIDALEKSIVKESEHHENIKSALSPAQKKLASLQEEFGILNKEVERIEDMLEAYEQGKAPLPDASLFIN
ncbi:hypothetical protein EIL50_03845 [bacterium NHP-B]|nr:hypothetical protein EIL50_03845 [bacterium NHP-B]